MKAKIAIIAFVSFLFSLNTQGAFAAGLTLSSTQTSINSGDEFNVDVKFSISSANGTIYYLRGVFYQTAGNYCGYTWNGNSWYNGPYSVNSGWQQLLAVTVNQSSWSGQLKAKIDPSDGNCQSSGNYYFKIQRYTNGGSGSFDDQNSLSLNVFVPTPTPTPLPTSTPLPTPSNTPTPKPSPTKTLLPTNQENITDTNASSSDVLGTSTNQDTPTNSKENVKVESISSDNVVGKIFLFLGIIFAVLCGIVFSWPYRHKIIKKFRK